MGSWKRSLVLVAVLVVVSQGYAQVDLLDNQSLEVVNESQEVVAPSYDSATRELSIKPSRKDDINAIRFMDSGTAQILNIWCAKESALDFANGPIQGASSSFPMWLCRQGDELRLRSGFDNDGVIEVIYADGTKERLQASNPTSLSNDSNLSNEKNTSKYAGAVEVIVQAEDGGYRDYRNLSDELKNNGSWQREDVNSRWLRTLSDGGYVGQCSVQTNQSTEEVINGLPEYVKFQRSEDRQVYVTVPRQ